MKKFIILFGVLCVTPVFASSSLYNCEVSNANPQIEEITIKCESNRSVITLRGTLLTYELKGATNDRKQPEHTEDK